MSSIKEIFYNEAMQGFINEKKEIDDYCKNCNYLAICNGGCRRLNKVICLNESKDYCGYKDFLDDKIEEMRYIANLI